MNNPLPRMKRAWERTRTVPGLGRDVAALLVLVILGTATTSFVLINQRYDWPWQDKFEFQADFAEVPGISPSNGQEVRIAGVTVGSISEATLTDTGNARLTLSLEPGHSVYQDTRLVLRPKTPLNDMYVEMSEGTPEAGRLEEGDVVPLSQTANPVQVDRVIQNLDEDAQAGISAILQESDVALAHAPQYLGPGLDATEKTLAKFKPVMEALRTRRETLARLVTALSQVAQATGGDEKRLARITSSLASTVDVIAARDTELEASLAQMPGFASELRGATGGITRLSAQLDPTLAAVRKASKSLPGALSDFGDLANELENTAETAAPLAREARPVVSDLRPVIPSYRNALTDLSAATGRLDYASKVLVEYLDDLSAFVYNTTSIFSLGDANGGILRGQAQVNASSLPFAIGGAR
jgi:phospholipid/cholesterol/gamma-HCH transport system substrate-binding protein